MNTLVRTYEGDDLVIPRKLIEEMGVKPGASLIIRPKITLEPRVLSPQEVEQRNKILDQLSGSWTAEDEAAYARFRHEMWTQWETRKSL
jgi:hypothetical protein